MKTKVILAATTAVMVPVGASAATAFFDESAFFSAVSGRTLVSEGFQGVADGTLLDNTTFDSGVTVNPAVVTSDNTVEGELLRLSVDNTGGLSTFVDLTFPVATTAFAFEFGELNEDIRVSGRGIGNDSGTTLGAGGFSYNFSDLFSEDPGYVGFFGVVADAGEQFNTVRFSTNGIGDFVDDDFSLDNLTFAPVPLPAGLPLLAAGLGVFGFVRSRRKA